MAKDIFIYNPTYAEERVQDRNEETFADGTTKLNKAFDLQEWVRSIIEEYGAGSIAGVTSVFGRLGAIIPDNGDYSASMITSLPTGQVLGTTVQSAINELESKKVAKNAPISPSARTKVAYDDKGLVTAGYDATTLDIIEDTNLYFTEARVSATSLTGLATNLFGTVFSTDTILQAFGKLNNSIAQAHKYVRTFSTLDWIITGNIAQIILLQAIHQRGLNPACVVKETIGGFSKDVLVDVSSNDTTGDVTISVNSTDIFSGKIIIL